MNIDIDSSFSTDEYDIIWKNQNIQINEFNNCKNFVITFKEVDVSQIHTIRCIVKSHKPWHKYQFYDCEITLMFPVLPPL